MPNDANKEDITFRRRVVLMDRCLYEASVMLYARQRDRGFHFSADNVVAIGTTLFRQAVADGIVPTPAEVREAVTAMNVARARSKGGVSPLPIGVRGAQELEKVAREHGVSMDDVKKHVHEVYLSSGPEMLHWDEQREVLVWIVAEAPRAARGKANGAK